MAMTEASAKASEPSRDEITVKRKTNFLDLPVETQQEIMEHCLHSDLISVAVTSRHFHKLASTVLYRNFHIIFPDEDDPDFDLPKDGLAGGLDTFATSDYNYAAHLKDLSMETVSTGFKAEVSYQPYLYSASCGKFLNSLLHLTIKRAKALEVFRWNIRVELSRAVYRELHRLSSLKSLHIRLQAGDSYYEPPPPLPVYGGHNPDALDSWSNNTLVSSTSPSNSMSHSHHLSSHFHPSSPPNPSPAPKTSKSRANRRAQPAAKEPSTMAGFKNLRNLAVLDIDSLDIIPEIATCVKGCLGLKDLQLSFSDNLASKARKPSIDSDQEDSDVEDEFQVVPASQSSPYDSSVTPAKVFLAQEERKAQESVLGKIFGTEPSLTKKSNLPQVAEREPKSVVANAQELQNTTTIADPREVFISSIKGASQKLMGIRNGSPEFSSSQQDILDVIEQAARKYVKSHDDTQGALQTYQDESSTDLIISRPSLVKLEGGNPIMQELKNTTANFSKVNLLSDGLADPASTPPRAAPTQTSIFQRDNKVPLSNEAGADKLPKSRGKGKGLGGDALPHDLDIRHDDLSEDHIRETTTHSSWTSKENTNRGQQDANLLFANEATTSSVNSSRAIAQSEVVADLFSKLTKFRDQFRLLDQEVAELQDTERDDVRTAVIAAKMKLQEFGHAIDALQTELMEAESELRRMGPESDTAGGRASQKDYIRDTRGLSLESLSIHQIPVKPSVLSRAINLPFLKKLVLLNVGNQAPIWSLLAKENRVEPLALRSISTDNVSISFLSLVSQLPELHELFLLERGVKHRPESFTQPSTVTIDQIRKLALKKHISTLQRLIIKDESGSTAWDLSDKATRLICTGGIKLEELAVSMDIHVAHTFMQHISSLVSLHALQIIHFRSNDTCIWVMREMLRFITDNISHHPHLKLEWVVMGDERVDRIIRVTDSKDAKTAGGKKYKSHMAAATTTTIPPMPSHGGWMGSMASDPFPTFPTDDSMVDYSDSDSEDEDVQSGKVRLEIDGPMQFDEVWEVKIFGKEIRTGRL